MKYALIIIALFGILYSCGGDDDISQSIPECIQNRIDNNEFIAVHAQMEGREIRYWLETGIRFADGSEDIVDADCVLQCVICDECIRPDCYSDYNHNNWETLWEE